MTPALRLHPMEPADLDFVRQLATDERVTRYVGDGRPWSDAYLAKRIEEALQSRHSATGRDVRWYVAEDTAGRQVGLLALSTGAADTVIGYWIHPDAWGRGHAGELIVHARRLATTQLPLEAVVHRHNAGSRRVLERAGFDLVEQAGSTSDELTYRWDRPRS